MSLLIVIHSTRKVIVANDSRAMNESGEVAGDHYRKIFRCGERSVCAIIGWIGDTDDAFDVSDRVRLLCERPNLQDQPIPLLEAIREELETPLRMMEPEKFASDCASAFAAIVMRRTKNEELDFVELRFALATIDGRRTIEAPEVIRHLEAAPRPDRFHYVSGWADTITHNLAQRLDPDDCTDFAILRDIDRIYEATKQTKYGTDIGGPVNVACLDSAGFRWLRENRLVPGRRGRQVCGDGSKGLSKFGARS